MKEHTKLLQKPALLIQPGRDDIFPESASAKMEKWIPNLEKKMIEKCSHWVQEEEPEQLNTILVDWLLKVAQITSRL